MKDEQADKIKANTARDLITCRCGHIQTEHICSRPQGTVIGRYTYCVYDHCPCRQFVSILNGREKLDIDKELDRQVAAGKLAGVLRSQPLPKPGRGSRVARLKARKREAKRVP